MKMIDLHHILLDSINTEIYDTSATAKSIVETVKDLCLQYPNLPNLKTLGDELGKYYKDNDEDIVQCLKDNKKVFFHIYKNCFIQVSTTDNEYYSLKLYDPLMGTKGEENKPAAMEYTAKTVNSVELQGCKPNGQIDLFIETLRLDAEKETTPFKRLCTTLVAFANTSKLETVYTYHKKPINTHNCYWKALRSTFEDLVAGAPAHEIITSVKLAALSALKEEHRSKPGDDLVSTNFEFAKENLCQRLSKEKYTTSEHFKSWETHLKEILDSPLQISQQRLSIPVEGSIDDKNIRVYSVSEHVVENARVTTLSKHAFLPTTKEEAVKQFNVFINDYLPKRYPSEKEKREMNHCQLISLNLILTDMLQSLEKCNNSPNPSTQLDTDDNHQLALIQASQALSLNSGEQLMTQTQRDKANIVDGIIRSIRIPVKIYDNIPNCIDTFEEKINTLSLIFLSLLQSARILSSGEIISVKKDCEYHVLTYFIQLFNQFSPEIRKLLPINTLNASYLDPIALENLEKIIKITDQFKASSRDNGDYINFNELQFIEGLDVPDTLKNASQSVVLEETCHACLEIKIDIIHRRFRELTHPIYTFISKTKNYNFDRDELIKLIAQEFAQPKYHLTNDKIYDSATKAADQILKDLPKEFLKNEHTFAVLGIGGWGGGVFMSRIERISEKLFTKFDPLSPCEHLDQDILTQICAETSPNAALCSLDIAQVTAKDKAEQTLQYVLATEMNYQPKFILSLADCIQNDQLLFALDIWKNKDSTPKTLYKKQHSVWESFIFKRQYEEESTNPHYQENLEKLGKALTEKTTSLIQDASYSNVPFLIHGMALLLDYAPKSEALMNHGLKMLKSCHSVFSANLANDVFKMCAILAQKCSCRYINELTTENLSKVYLIYFHALVSQKYRSIKNSPSYFDHWSKLDTYYSASIFSMWSTWKNRLTTHAQEMQAGFAAIINSSEYRSFIKLFNVPRQYSIFPAKVDQSFTLQAAAVTGTESIKREIKIYPYGDVISPFKLSIDLPNSLRENKTFKNLFPNTDKHADVFMHNGTIVFKYGENYFRCTQNETVYKFYYLNNAFQNDEVLYYLTNHVSAHLLFSSRSVWAKCNQSTSNNEAHPLYFIFKDLDQNPCTSVKRTRFNYKIHHEDKDVKMPEDDNHWLGKIATKDQVYIYEEAETDTNDTTHLSQVLHALNLGLSFQEIEGGFKCLQFPGYVIKQVPAIDDFFMKTFFSSYIVLEKEGQKPRIIIPNCHSKQRVRNNENFRLRAETIKINEMERADQVSTPYYVYEWNESENRPEHSDIDARWYLLYLLVIGDKNGAATLQALNLFKTYIIDPNTSLHDDTIDRIKEICGLNRHDCHHIALLASPLVNRILKYTDGNTRLGLTPYRFHQQAYLRQLNNIPLIYRMNYSFPQNLQLKKQDHKLKKITATNPIEVKFATGSSHHFEMIQDDRSTIEAQNSTIEAKLLTAGASSASQLYSRIYQRDVWFEVNTSYIFIDNQYSISKESLGLAYLIKQGDYQEVSNTDYWGTTKSLIVKTPLTISTIRAKWKYKLQPFTLNEHEVKWPYLIEKLKPHSIQAKTEEHVYDYQGSTDHENDLKSLIKASLEEVSNTPTSHHSAPPQIVTYAELCEKTSDLHKELLALYEKKTIQTHSNLFLTPVGNQTQFRFFLQTFAGFDEFAQKTLGIDTMLSYIRLKTMVKDYLWHETERHALERANGTTANYTQRQYTWEHPHAYHILLLEYIEKIRLRPGQLDMINALTEQENGVLPRRVVEAIMGSGKTTASPLLAIVRSQLQKGKLSLLLLPSQQFDIQGKDIKQQMRRVYGVEPSVIKFDRAELRSHDWDDTLQKMQRAVECGIPMLSTAETLASLHLSFIEELQKDNRKIYNRKIDHLAKVLKKINKATVITDEFDDVYGSSPVIYSFEDSTKSQKTGQKPINTFSSFEIETLLPLYKSLHTVRSELNPNYLSTKKIAKDDYFDCILPKLLNHLMNNSSFNHIAIKLGLSTAAKRKFLQLMEDATIQAEPLKEAITQLHLESYAEANHYKIISDIPPAVVEENSKNNEKFILKAQILHHFIHSILPVTLTMPVDLCYGKDLNNKDSRTVIPYNNGTACLDSRFENPNLTLSLTALSALRDGFSHKELEQIINHFFSDFKQSRLQASQKVSINLTKLALIIKPDSFSSFYEGLEQLEINSSKLKQKIQELYHELQKPEHREHYMLVLWQVIQALILPKIEFSTQKLRYSWPCAVSANHVSGFSGTTHNIAKFPLHASPTNRRIDATTIQIINGLASNFYHEKILDNITQYCQAKPKTRAIIDAGSLLKTPGGMHRFVKNIYQDVLEATNCKALLYFEETGFFAIRINDASVIQLTSFNEAELNSQLNIPPEERFWIYSASRSRGTDAKLMHDAHVLVLARMETNFAALMQAAMRARQLGQGQTIDFVLEDSLLQHFNFDYSKTDFKVTTQNGTPLQFDEYWQLLIDKDIEELKPDSFVSTIDYIGAVYQNSLYNTLLMHSSSLGHATCIQIINDFFITQSKTPLERMLQSRDMSNAIHLLNEYAAEYNDKYRAIADKLITAQTSELQNQANDIIEMMKPHIQHEIEILNKLPTAYKTCDVLVEQSQKEDQTLHLANQQGEEESQTLNSQILEVNDEAVNEQQQTQSQNQAKAQNQERNQVASILFRPNNNTQHLEPCTMLHTIDLTKINKNLLASRNLSNAAEKTSKHYLNRICALLFTESDIASANLPTRPTILLSFVDFNLYQQNRLILPVELAGATIKVVRLNECPQEENLLDSKINKDNLICWLAGMLLSGNTNALSNIQDRSGSNQITYSQAIKDKLSDLGDSLQQKYKTALQNYVFKSSAVEDLLNSDCNKEHLAQLQKILAQQSKDFDSLLLDNDVFQPLIKTLQKIHVYNVQGYDNLNPTTKFKPLISVLVKFCKFIRLKKRGKILIAKLLKNKMQKTGNRNLLQTLYKQAKSESQFTQKNADTISHARSLSLVLLALTLLLLLCGAYTGHSALYLVAFFFSVASSVLHILTMFANNKFQTSLLNRKNNFGIRSASQNILAFRALSSNKSQAKTAMSFTHKAIRITRNISHIFLVPAFTMMLITGSPVLFKLMLMIPSILLLSWVDNKLDTKQFTAWMKSVHQTIKENYVKPNGSINLAMQSAQIFLQADKALEQALIEQYQVSPETLSSQVSFKNHIHNKLKEDLATPQDKDLLLMAIRYAKTQGWRASFSHGNKGTSAAKLTLLSQLSDHIIEAKTDLNAQWLNICTLICFAKENNLKFPQHQAKTLNEKYPTKDVLLAYYTHLIRAQLKTQNGPIQAKDITQILEKTDEIDQHMRPAIVLACMEYAKEKRLDISQNVSDKTLPFFKNIMHSLSGLVSKTKSQRFQFEKLLSKIRTLYTKPAISLPKSLPEHEKTLQTMISKVDKPRDMLRESPLMQALQQQKLSQSAYEQQFAKKHKAQRLIADFKSQNCTVKVDDSFTKLLKEKQENRDNKAAANAAKINQQSLVFKAKALNKNVIELSTTDKTATLDENMYKLDISVVSIAKNIIKLKKSLKNKLITQEQLKEITDAISSWNNHNPIVNCSTENDDTQAMQLHEMIANPLIAGMTIEDYANQLITLDNVIDPRLMFFEDNESNIPTLSAHKCLDQECPLLTKEDTMCKELIGFNGNKVNVDQFIKHYSPIKQTCYELLDEKLQLMNNLSSLHYALAYAPKSYIEISGGQLNLVDLNGSLAKIRPSETSGMTAKT